MTKFDETFTVTWNRGKSADEKRVVKESECVLTGDFNLTVGGVTVAPDGVLYLLDFAIRQSTADAGNKAGDDDAVYVAEVEKKLAKVLAGEVGRGEGGVSAVLAKAAILFRGQLAHKVKGFATMKTPDQNAAIAAVIESLPDGTRGDIMDAARRQMATDAAEAKARKERAEALAAAVDLSGI